MGTPATIQPELLRVTDRGDRHAPYTVKVGDRFGELLAVEPVGVAPNDGARLWVCKCSCGNVVVRGSNRLTRAVRHGRSPSCAACRDRVRMDAARGEVMHDLFSQQFAEYGSLWLPLQSEALADRVLCDLEETFGFPLEDDADLPIRREADWADPDRSLVDALQQDRGDDEPWPPYRGVRICGCRWCAQRIAWSPADGPQACSARCAARYAAWERRVAREARIRAQWDAVRKPDPPPRSIAKPTPPEPVWYERLVPAGGEVIGRIVDGLQRQFAERHGIDAYYVGAGAARGLTVLQFRATNQGDRAMHVILNGSGPGRAAWVFDARSMDEAVSRIAPMAISIGG